MKKRILLSLFILLSTISNVGCKEKSIDYTKDIESSYTAKSNDLSISFVSKTLDIIDNKECLVLKTKIKNTSNELIYPTDFFIIAEQDYNELLVVDEILQENNYNIAYTESNPIKSNSEVTLDYIFELQSNRPINLYLHTLNDTEPITLEENFILK